MKQQTTGNIGELVLERSKHWLEYIGGARDLPPTPAAQLPSWFWGVWWALLITVACVFSGQASKFIYIDF
jgi:hypothetical protein